MPLSICVDRTPPRVSWEFEGVRCDVFLVRLINHFISPLMEPRYLPSACSPRFAGHSVPLSTCCQQRLVFPRQNLHVRCSSSFSASPNVRSVAAPSFTFPKHAWSGRASPVPGRGPAKKGQTHGSPVQSGLTVTSVLTKALPR